VQGIDGAVGNVRRPIAFDQRVAIGRRARDPADTDAAGRAGAFSTMTAWPSEAAMRPATMRATVSAPPPAA